MRARLTCALLISLLLSIPTALSQEGYSYGAFILTVYADGAVHVSETLSVDPTEPFIEVTLLTSSVEYLLVTDENGTLLDNTPTDGTILIDTLGATRAVIEYDCLDLTSKLGALWTLAVDSPANFTLTFPANTTVISVSQIPLEIKSLDDGLTLVMPSGNQQVSYVIGLFGPEAQATEAIALAEATIETLTSQGLNLSLSVAKLNEARTAYEVRDYTSAKTMAEQAMTLAYSTRDLAATATTAILRAESAISLARAQGRTDGIAEAEILLAGSRQLSDSGQYAEASALAQQAQVAAEKATAPFPTYWVIAGGAAFAALASALLLLYFKRRAEPEDITFDLAGLYREKPWLNPDQRKVIEFLAARKGSAFEAEIREAVNQPKSTVWRIIRKLDEEGIVTIEQLRGQNYVNLTVGPRAKTTPRERKEPFETP